MTGMQNAMGVEHTAVKARLVVAAFVAALCVGAVGIAGPRGAGSGRVSGVTHVTGPGDVNTTRAWRTVLTATISTTTAGPIIVFVMGPGGGQTSSSYLFRVRVKVDGENAFPGHVSWNGPKMMTNMFAHRVPAGEHTVRVQVYVGYRDTNPPIPRPAPSWPNPSATIFYAGVGA